jgi:hypothetical protein
MIGDSFANWSMDSPNSNTPPYSTTSNIPGIGESPSAVLPFILRVREVPDAGGDILNEQSGYSAGGEEYWGWQATVTAPVNGWPVGPLVVELVSVSQSTVEASAEVSVQ